MRAFRTFGVVDGGIEESVSILSDDNTWTVVNGKHGYVMVNNTKADFYPGSALPFNVFDDPADAMRGAIDEIADELDRLVEKAGWLKWQLEELRRFQADPGASCTTGIDLSYNGEIGEE